MSDLASALHIAAEMVRSGDPDRFAATLPVPAGLRDRLWPIYAANLEIARAPWVSSEPVVAEMRLQWWIDELEALSNGQVPRHEIGPALAPLAAQARHLVGVAEARRIDCWPEPHADAAGLWAYLDATAGNLYWAAAEALGASPEAEVRVRAFASGAGLAALLEALPELIARGRPPLPDRSPGAIGALAAEGLGRLKAGRKAVSGAAGAALLPGWRARPILQRARNAPHSVLDGTLRGSEFSRRFRLLRAAFFGL